MTSARATTASSTHTASPNAASATGDPNEIAARLRLSTTRLARRLRTEAEIGLTPSLLSALAVVHVHGPMTLGAVAEREGLAPPSVTKIVAKLEDQQLVRRIQDPDDGRVCRVATTDRGEDLLERSRARKNAWLAERLADVGPEELAVLARAADVIDGLLSVDRGEGAR